MDGVDRLGKGDWEAILHAPFHVYSAVAAADGEPMEAQFRALRDQLKGGHGAFPDGAVGRTMVDTVTANLDALWAGYQASGRSPKDGIGRARKALRRVPDDASAAVGDWLLGLARTVADARRTIGEAPMSEAEAAVIEAIAGWLDRPLPDHPTG